MNAGGDAADQLVKYSFEGMEVALRLTGDAAKNFAVFAAAALKSQEKSHGKTNLIKLLRQHKAVKFFTVPTERMHEFAGEAKRYGLLFVPMRDKKNPGTIEIAVVADDAAKVNRIMDRMALDFLKATAGEANLETVSQKLQGGDAMKDKLSVADKNFTQTPAAVENETSSPGEDRLSQTPMSENPSVPSSRTQSFLQAPNADDVRSSGQKPSVRQELHEIKEMKAAEKQRQPVRQRPPKTKKKVKGR